MKAAVVERYGPPEVVSVREVPDPAAGAGQVVVRVAATTVNSGDARIRGAQFPRGFATPARLVLGVRGPRRQVLGVTLSGVVEQVGGRVTGLAVGDEVCGMTGAGMGAHAELVAVKADKLVRKPAAVSHADAAAVLFGGSTALHFLRDRVRPGTAVLVNGASGSVGAAAVQLAHRAGGRVTGVCGPTNGALVESLGAAAVIDYARTPLDTVAERYDVVLDTVGSISTAVGRSLVAPGGVLLLVVADLWSTLRARGDVVAGVAPERAEDFTTLLELVESGELETVVDRTLPLADVVEAHRIVDSGHKVGNLVVTP
ncbi:NAD(P)-dependent alcohol dehydrogenase [Nocardioides sp. zg-1308]|uniref:NAD(P)-dependent alcohol dehydrogenase n=1 Tax=Nocardioides sp. zg-1308 TaxID=2736253 RepID=UPI001554EF3D|nr:NAD(P)-dependent alcohol dehydrogenase [Nocardioides sp. zg-1308]NPD05464.1 NAD(P)-dependent alcohol dehydrogenase [Nocardioides sp. zg-1308]